MNTKTEKSASPVFEAYLQTSRELTDVGAVLTALTWDQETMMPEKGAAFRARQMATLSAIHHSKLTDPRFGGILEELGEEDLDLWGAASLNEARRIRDKALKLPPDLVRELAETTSLAYQSWVRARRDSDLSEFAPWLEKLTALKRRQAECLQIGETLYDSLLDDYEPGMTTRVLDPLFSQLRPRLSELLQRVEASPVNRTRQPIRGFFPLDKQQKFGRKVATAMGFDWKAGRLDDSPHPFCCGLTPLDVRITTRYQEDDFSTAFFGIIHETGHALYEQGLNAEKYGLTACETISLGIHESQSRLWENCVARSRTFWKFWYPGLKETFPGQLDDVPLDDFLAAVNRVKPSLIRVDADELTYGLHVILRYEIEKALLSHDLEARDLEGVWNEKMEEYLGVSPADAAQGVLQDVHWSQGLFGYFPTYLLGTLYATQFHRQAQLDLPDYDQQVGTGQMLPLREWLREKIHSVGMTRSADQLIREVTGEPLQADYFVDYLEKKYGELYGF